MNYFLQKALADWHSEVDIEMAKLIESGVPPFDAATKAASNIMARRRRKAEQNPNRIPPAEPTSTK